MFKGTQEAIIDPDTWEIVQRVREGKRRPTRMGTMDKFSGLVFCADCGNRHYCIRSTSMTSEQINYICGTNRKKGKEACTAHFIRAAVLEQLVLDDIRRVTRFAKSNEQEFVRMLMDKSAAESRRELNSKRRELEKAKRRIEELDRIFRKLYEDRINGILTDQRFESLSQGYEQEQKELTAKTEQLEREIQESGEKAVHMDRFLAIVHKYTDIRELTPELLREFIQRIEVHERSIYRSPKATQQVDIYYNFVGMLPEASEAEE